MFDRGFFEGRRAIAIVWLTGTYSCRTKPVQSMRFNFLFAAIPFCGLRLAAQSPAIAVPGDGPVLEGTTTCSAGFRWSVPSDANRNSRVSLHYRPKGSEWIEGAPLWKVGKDE